MLEVKACSRRSGIRLEEDVGSFAEQEGPLRPPRFDHCLPAVPGKCNEFARNAYPYMRTPRRLCNVIATRAHRGLSPIACFVKDPYKLIERCYNSYHTEYTVNPPSKVIDGDGVRNVSAAHNLSSRERIQTRLIVSTTDTGIMIL